MAGWKSYEQSHGAIKKSLTLSGPKGEEIIRVFLLNKDDIVTQVKKTPAIF